MANFRDAKKRIATTTKEGFESIGSARSFDEIRETQAYEQCTSAASAVYESEMHTDDGSQIITLTYILCAALE